MKRIAMTKKEQRTANSTLAIGGFSSTLDSFVVAESSVLRTNFCAEKPAHRQSAKRGREKRDKLNQINKSINFPYETRT